MELEIKPDKEEIEEAREIARETFSECKEEMPKEQDLKIGISWTEDETTLKQMGGTSAEETLDAHTVVVKFNSRVENWRENLKRTIAHEYAHTVFWENVQEIKYEWEWVLFEAHGIMFAEKMYPDTEAPWAEKISEEELKERWLEAREKLKTESDWGSFWYGSEKWPQWFGYTLSYRIGKKLLQKYKIEDLPGLDREKVLETGNEIFGE